MQIDATNKHLRYKKTKCVLGEGSYKTVSKAIDEEEGKEVAYNEVKIKHYEDENQTVVSFSKEIALLKSVDHPNIIQIVDYWFSEDNFIFITELMAGGSLRDYIQKNGPLSTKLIRKWGKQILEGLRYLHSLSPPIIHRDIKNDNIFVNTAIGEVKIGDLGLAREKKHKRYTIVGTPHFMAREMFEGEGYTEKIDVYAFGMCLVEMATGQTPYNEFKDTTEIYKNVLQGILPKAMQSITHSCLKSLIMGCLVPVASRYTAAQCLDHHFFYPDVVCTGDCIPREAVAVYPLNRTPVRGMELSIVSIVDGIILFQILLQDTMKFIKFEYNLKEDTVKKICDELLAERILADDALETFSSLLVTGLETAEGKIRSGQIHDGMIELNSSEANEIKEQDRIITNTGTGNNQTNDGQAINPVESDSFHSVGFGADTLEEMRLIEENMKIHEAKKELERKREEEITQKLRSKLQQRVEGSKPPKVEDLPLDDNLLCTVEIAKSVKFKNESTPQKELYADFVSENIYTQFPNAPESSDGREIAGRVMELAVSSPKAIWEATSPPFCTTRFAEDATDFGLNESYELCKAKYKSNFPIAQYTLDVAAITERTEDTAKSWLKILREEDIEAVFDLKILAYEDWEKLPLTVFSCRAMQNMLYGINGVPQKERQQPFNPGLREYENKMSIKAFLIDVCGTVNRMELVSSWEDRLLAQDIQTVGELKSLHHEDWNRLGLTVYAFRILKNVIFRKGRIVID